MIRDDKTRYRDAMSATNAEDEGDMSAAARCRQDDSNRSGEGRETRDWHMCIQASRSEARDKHPSIGL